MNFELLKHISEIPQTLVLTWVLMGIRVPISFQSRFSNEDYFGVLYTTKPFKKKGFGRHGFSSVVARPGAKIVPLYTPKFSSLSIASLLNSIGLYLNWVWLGFGGPILFQSCFSKLV
jgi:hypothetical protein